MYLRFVYVALELYEETKGTKESEALFPGSFEFLGVFGFLGVLSILLFPVFPN